MLRRKLFGKWLRLRARLHDHNLFHKLRGWPESVERLVLLVQQRAVLDFTAPLLKFVMHKLPQRADLGIRLGLGL